MEDTTKKMYKLSNPLMFAIVMLDESLCKELLNRILPERRVKEIRFADDWDPKTLHHEIEKAIIAGLDAKSIRLDVLFEDDEARYDIELQVKGSQEIPKRSRYYQAVMAVDDLKKGRRYSALKPCYVIFICLFDLMGLGSPVYRFQMLDDKNHLPLGDEQFIIMVNTTSKAEDTPKELQALYRYLEREEITEGDSFIERLHETVQNANRNREVRSIMTLSEEMENREYFARQEGKAAGLKEGRESGLKEGRESGLKEGLKEGEKLAQEKIALKLKASGMNPAQIAEITGLSEEEAAALSQ